MHIRSCLLTLAALLLVSCEAPPRNKGTSSASFYYPSTKHTPVPKEVTTSRTPATTPVPRGGYAPGSGPTAMPAGDQLMHQYRESGPFGSYSNSTVIQSSGPIQDYQTIGNVPVYPGSSVPGYVPDQPYYGSPASQQPVHVPGTGGNPGYYINPWTGARVTR